MLQARSIAVGPGREIKLQYSSCCSKSTMADHLRQCMCGLADPAIPICRLYVFGLTSGWPSLPSIEFCLQHDCFVG